MSRTAHSLQRRRFMQMAGLAAASVPLGGLLGACGGSGGAGGGDQQSVKLAVAHWPDFLYGVPWAVAVQEGIFKKAGLTVEGIVGSTGGGTTVRNVVTGGLPLGAVAAPAAINAFQAGAPLLILAGAIQSTAEITYVTTRDNDAINSLEDLKGKRIGFTEPGSATQALALLALKSAGIGPREARLQATGGVPEGLTLLKKGAIDVAPSFLPLPLDEWKVVFPSTDPVPNFMSVVLVAGQRAIEEEPELIKSLLDVYRKGIDVTVRDPATAAKAWVSQSEVSPEAAKRSLEEIDRDKFYGTELNPEGLAMAVEAMKATGELKDAVDWKAMLDQRFLTDAEKVDVSRLA